MIPALQLGLPTLLIGLMIFGFAPRLVLRIVLLSFHRSDPRRRELMAELYAVPRFHRPFWVAEQFEVALVEGLGARMVNGLDRHVAQVMNIRFAGEKLPTTRVGRGRLLMIALRRRSHDDEQGKGYGVIAVKVVRVVFPRVLLVEPQKPKRGTASAGADRPARRRLVVLRTRIDLTMPFQNAEEMHELTKNMPPESVIELRAG